MTLSEDIRSAVRSKTAIIGYRETIKFLKSGSGAKTVIVANNTPDEMSESVKQNAKISGMELKNFEGTSKDMGTACGKPFPVAAMVIKG